MRCADCEEEIEHTSEARFCAECTLWVHYLCARLDSSGSLVCADCWDADASNYYTDSE